jgi:hypothetical protein
MAAGQFTPEPSGKDCTEKAGGWGTKSTVYDYIWKGDLDQSNYPEDACTPCEDITAMHRLIIFR